MSILYTYFDIVSNLYTHTSVSCLYFIQILWYRVYTLYHTLISCLYFIPYFDFVSILCTYIDIAFIFYTDTFLACLYFILILWYRVYIYTYFDFVSIIYTHTLISCLYFIHILWWRFPYFEPHYMVACLYLMPHALVSYWNLIFQKHLCLVKLPVFDLRRQVLLTTIVHDRQ